MPRWALLLLLAAGVLGAGAGTALVLLTTPLGGAGFGWTAYSPLSDTAYLPGAPTSLFWTPKVAVALLAVGAGTTGSAAVALLLTRRRLPRFPATSPPASSAGDVTDRRASSG